MLIIRLAHTEAVPEPADYSHQNFAEVVVFGHPFQISQLHSIGRIENKQLKFGAKLALNTK